LTDLDYYLCDFGNNNSSDVVIGVPIPALKTLVAGSRMPEISTWMRSFVAVSDGGSFSAAAERLLASQSTVSKHVAALEAHLKIRLFNRTTRSLNLTTDGAVFYESALVALAAIEAAEASVGLVGEAKGVLRITAPLTLAESRVISMLGRFLAANPKIEIDFAASDHALNLVADNLDLAIRVGQLNDDRLKARHVGVARRVAVASPAYLDRMGRPMRPSDLNHHNCLSYSLLSAGPRWEFRDGSFVEIGGNFRTDSPNALRAAALAGVGVAVNAKWLFENEIESGKLEVVLPEFEPVSMPIHILLPRGRYVTARTRALVDFLTEEFAGDPLFRHFILPVQSN
jgi:LysR family transcriptional regulator, regulator for bpeEF and oprC